MRKLLLCSLLGLLSLPSFAQNTHETTIRNLVRANPQYLELATQFTLVDFVKTYKNKSLSFAEFQQLLVQKFYQPFNLNYQLTSNSYTSASVEAFLNIYHTCAQVRQQLTTQEIIQLDRKYQLICSKTDLIYTISGRTDADVYAYSLMALNDKVTPAQVKALGFSLPTYATYQSRNIFEHIANNLQITITE
ncbi:hypothetical protein [Psittacicella gerlachiana]|uniref:Uncharacterized protein n=1 Tax=Psittacicella gerlachiana TaxID=2028574 RepID=A0A3A1Y960_9GAMM|nr:hypothetical protein [Psittacicella gerlachiana]RIY32674.1 hypothetical protein CKF59_06800 [Psittacicella gerlachiana]